jgi:hypothetical protein
VWHASICLRARSGEPTRTEEVPRPSRRLAFALGRELLEGWGTGPTIEHVKGIAFHVRRRLSPAELEVLDPAWLAIAPIDLG